LPSLTIPSQDLVEHQIPWYLDASFPIEEQDEEQLDTLVTKVGLSGSFESH
jgi:hypothetical protein